MTGDYIVKQHDDLYFLLPEISFFNIKRQAFQSAYLLPDRYRTETRSFAKVKATKVTKRRGI